MDMLASPARVHCIKTIGFCLATDCNHVENVCWPYPSILHKTSHCNQHSQNKA